MYVPMCMYGVYIVCATDEPFLVDSGHELRYYVVGIPNLRYPCVRFKRVTAYVYMYSAHDIDSIYDIISFIGTGDSLTFGNKKEVRINNHYVLLYIMFCYYNIIIVRRILL